MKKFIVVILLTTSLTLSYAQSNSIDYGNNSAVGKFAKVNGINMYYEIYGEGEPLLLLHGNGGSIKGHTERIKHFQNKYKVIAVDSRAHGKTKDIGDSLTYLQMANDVNALLDQLKIDSCYVWGQSDGGILGLILAMDYPKKVKKLATFGANLKPDTTAVFTELAAWVERELANAKDDHQRSLLKLMIYQPQIEYADLSKIKVPVLIMSGDRDAIRLEHSLQIFYHIPKSNLFIMPGSTHFGAYEKTSLFNTVLDDFFSKPFSRRATTDILK